MFRIFILHLFKKYFNSLRRKKRIFYKETKIERKGYKVNDLYLRLKTKTRRTCRLDGYRRIGKVHCVNYFCRAVSLQAERASFVRNANPICASTKTCLCACLSKTKTRRTCRLVFVLVRETGIEPVWHNHTPLKRARLPIPPLSHI